MNDLVEVGIGPCHCPASLHPGGDVVSLRARLGLAGGMAVQGVVRAMLSQPIEERASVHHLTGQLCEVYLEEGVASWNLVDVDGEPLPLTPRNLREQVLDDFSRAEAAADRADTLYYDAVVAPLVTRAPASSPRSSIGASTSATKRRTPKRPKPSKRSSTTTIPMGATATITGPPAGGSS